MWYFAWILGVLLAAAFGIINVMWMEAEEMLGSENDRKQTGQVSEEKGFDTITELKKN
jgi:cytochrome bd-I ubiquinol oxidase subunit X